MSMSPTLHLALESRRTIVLFRQLTVGLAACLALFVGLSVQAQNIPHDPSLINKLRTRDFGRIESGSTSALGLAAVIRGFSDNGCRSDVDGGSASEVMQLTQSMMSEAGGPLQLMLIAVHPNYIQAASMVGTSGCNSTQVQNTMRNLVDYLRQRYARR